ncbi:signal peptide peptidase SppA [Enterococcus olivae]
MNRRRWIAVAIAVSLFVFSGVTALLRPPKDEMDSLSGLNALLYGTNELTEHIVEDGNTQNRIALLYVDGAITNTGGGMFATGGYNHQVFLEELKQIQYDPTIAAVMLQVNSPGGGVYESAEIAKEIRKVQELDVPVYVSMTNMAASGGYYISASADKIFATEETITGSIGVIMSGMNYSGLMEKLGIEDATYKSGALKDMGSGTREATEDDKQVLQGFVDSSYNRFVQVVSDGRGMPKEEVRELADGRIYDGAQALENGLIDDLGFPEDVLYHLQADNNLQGAQIIEYSLSATGFANTWFGSKLAEVQGLKQTDTDRMLNLLESIGTPNAPKALYYYGGE